MSEFLVILYDLTLVALQWIGGGYSHGFGLLHREHSTVCFVQPSLILILMGLWLRQIRKNRQLVENVIQSVLTAMTEVVVWFFLIVSGQ